jgi:cobalamin biosynthesis protein CbiG
MRKMLAIIFGSKKGITIRKAEASMDEKRREIYLKSDFLRRF